MVLAPGVRPRSIGQERFRGIRDSFDPSTSVDDLCYTMRNMYPSDHGTAAGALGRPGFARMGVGGGEQGGAGVNRRPQCHGQLSKADGTEVTFRVCGGRLDTYNWATDIWTNVALGGGAGLPVGVKVFWVQFGQKVIFQPNDGINKPFSWDGAAAFVVLGNCPLLWGPLTIYYAKVFGVKWASRVTAVWSEEADETLGYDTLPYNNAWDLIQTSNDAIYALVGSNEALYYWHARSLSYVLGAVGPDFKSTGVRQGVSETIGTIAPAGMVVHEREVYFLDADARPWVLTFGGGLRQLWEDVRETSLRIPRTTLVDAEAADFTPLDFALIGYQGPDGTSPNRLFVIDTVTKAVAGLWDGFSFQSLGMVKNTAGVRKLVHGSPNGYSYLHGNPDEFTVLNDVNNAADGGTLPIYHEVAGPAMGYETDRQKDFSRIDLALMCYTNLTGVVVDYETPQGKSSTLLSQDIPGAMAVWDGTDNWDGGNWPVTAVERHLAYGLRARARWMRPRVRHQALNELFSITGWKAQAADAGTPPRSN